MLWKTDYKFVTNVASFVFLKLFTFKRLFFFISEYKQEPTVPKWSFSLLC